MSDAEPAQGMDPQDEYYASVLRDKYAKGAERTVEDVLRRVARGVAEPESSSDREAWSARFLEALRGGFYPAGRIMSAAGTGLQATLINCFVQPVGDSIAGAGGGKVGIYTALLEAAETMRRGGGVGYDFSAIRPRGALVRGTHSRASGPISYMRVFDRSCETVESAGARRGAQMAVLRVDHPDIEDFVHAKDLGKHLSRLRRQGLQGAALEEILQHLRPLANFNISVAVTDAFMRAKDEDREIELVHAAEPDPNEFPQAHQRRDGQWVYRQVPARRLWDEILATTYESADPGVVFIDRMNAENNLAYCERLEATNPCGEQPLPDYGCCCLGSINLARLVLDPFRDTARLDWAALESLVTIAVRMLDNVLDITYWPLAAQEREARTKRRIGLGFTGLGTALCMLRLRYGSDAAVAMTQDVARALRDHAYAASVQLAEERGPFPAFEAPRYLERPFIRRLPEALQKRIHAHGLRNSHLLSIAPTGTISLAFGCNVSSGIEPAFAWTYTRRTRGRDGTLRTSALQDYGYRLYLEAGGDPENLPPYFVNAQVLAPEDHLRMQAAVQPFVDSAISKTINVPADFSLEAFKHVYDLAYAWGCKGCTTYRPNPSTGAVLSVASGPAAGAAQPALELPADIDPRLRLQQLPSPPLASLRWPARPEFPAGNPAWTYLVDGGEGCRFAVVVGHAEEETGAHPFEVWVNGAEQPRGLGAIAKLLSMDMRSRDRAWLRLKLESLVRTRGHPIDTPVPPDGRTARMASPTAALARLVMHRCEELRTFESSAPTPVVDALISVGEPRTDTDGTMSWTVDVRNPATGDDFSVVLKELLLPRGERRPYAVALTGEYPRDFDGLCHLLSLDMRVLDPAWIEAKLRKLLTYPETGGSFLAFVPGERRQQVYPSSVAYLAALMLHRLRMLRVVATQSSAPGRSHGSQEPSGAVRPVAHGSRCPECGEHSVLRREGCEACTNCGWVGPCG